MGQLWLGMGETFPTACGCVSFKSLNAVSRIHIPSMPRVLSLSQSFSAFQSCHSDSVLWMGKGNPLIVSCTAGKIRCTLTHSPFHL